VSDLAIPRPVAARFKSQAAIDMGARVVAGLAIVLVWEIAVRLWAPAYVARPSGIVAVLPTVIADPAFWEAAGITLAAVLQGLAIAIAAGTVIGMAIGRLPVAERLLQVYVSGLFAMPMVAILPLLTLFFGYSGDARLATIVFAGIFAIVINVSDGARATPPEYLEVSRSFRGSPFSRLFDVILPSSVPYLLAGIKLAAGRAMIGAVIAEFYAALPGIGFYILFNTRTFRHNEAFVAVAVLALTAVAFELGLTRATVKYLPWYRRDERSE
jgi:ABC-type nitrate/sulfonate/bicarbonate transport system permease component